MSRDVDYTAAADWSSSDARDNFDYLISRGKVFEVEEALRLRDEKWDDVFSVTAPEIFPQPVPPEAATSSDPNAVPTGSVDEVLEWVGDNKDRAAAALAAEDEGKQRVTLVEALEAIVEG